MRNPLKKEEKEEANPVPDDPNDDPAYAGAMRELEATHKVVEALQGFSLDARRRIIAGAAVLADVVPADVVLKELGRPPFEATD